jgi:membrane protein
MANPVERLKSWWRSVRAKHSSADVAAASWTRLGDTNGNLYAGAITYFSFLALFPLLLLGVSIVGFVLSGHPDTMQTLFDKITTNVPGSVGKTLRDSIRTAVDSRTSIGIVGLAGVLLTGLGWIGNLRRAIDAIWARPPAERPFLKEKVGNLFILAGLGVGLLISVALTAAWTAATHEVLQLLSLDDVPGMGTLVSVAGILIAVLGDAVVFFWLIVGLPVVDVPKRVGIRGALLGAVGFEVLKIVGTFTVAHTANSPTAGPFAGVLAVLIWIQLVVRWFLYVVAVTAVLSERAYAARAAAEAAADPDAGPDPALAEPPVAAVSPVAVGATLVGAGAVAGAAAVAYATRRSNRD